jgi:hypothetical protein
VGSVIYSPCTAIAVLNQENEMLIEALGKKIYSISQLDQHGFLFTKKYYGYTKKEALFFLKIDLKEHNND